MSPQDGIAFEEATKQFVDAIAQVEGDEVVGWAHDRMDPDTMGAAGLCWFVLKEKWGKKFTCYYSKAMSFLMNRSIAKNFLPSRLLCRCEEEKDLAGIAQRSNLIVILDATSPEIMTDLSRLMRRSEEIRNKTIFFIDHHRKGALDVEDLPNAKGLRLEDAQATSAIMVHILRNLGLELNSKSEEHFRLAVAAKAGTPSLTSTRSWASAGRRSSTSSAGSSSPSPGTASSARRSRASTTTTRTRP